MSYPRVRCTHHLSLLVAGTIAATIFGLGCGSSDVDPFENQDIIIDDVEGYDVPDAGDVDPSDPDTDIPDTDIPDTDIPDTDIPDVDPPDPDDIVECDNPLPEPPAGERCVVLPGTNDHLVFQGTLLVGDEIYEEGTLIVDDQAPNRRIECAGCDCADDPIVDEATIVSCPDTVISPGLINPHDHLTFAQGWPQPHGDERYDHRHDWRTGARGHSRINVSPSGGSNNAVSSYGELRMLFGGATSIAGSTAAADASGLLRNLDQLDETEGLETIDVRYSTFPLGDSDGTLLAEGCAYGNIDSEYDDGIYLPHIAEGIDDEARNEIHCLAGASGRNLIQDNTSIIHGIAVNARDVAMIADRGATLVWSPRTNIDLYGNTAPVPLYHRFGVPIGLGTDWSTSGSMNMLRELECADYLNRMHFNNTFTDAELWKMATYWAAITMGADHKLGLLYPNYVADITIFDDRGRTPYRAIIDADIDEIALVLRGGEPLYGDAQLVEDLVGATDSEQCELVDVCDRDRRVCVELDIGETIADLEAAIPEDSYPLFFCGDPEDEPTCVPSRPSEYDGITGSDSSGDGVPDSVDNCPDYFNPIRPMDGGIQSDINGNGIGDVCDPCPLSEDLDCTHIDPGDWSGDGVPNEEDNCPFHYNPLQEDSSGDGVGDVCSPCPDREITPGRPCPYDIYEIKNGDVDEGTALELRDVLVTAVNVGEGLFVQVHPEEEGFQGVDRSGLYVYLRHDLEDEEFPQPGDRISIVGSVSVFFSQTQLADVSTVEILSSGHELPEPELVTPEEVENGGSRQWDLEGVLVEVQDLTVTDDDPGPGAGQQESPDEFVVNDSLYVNNFFYTIDPKPQVGDTFESITGVLRWANSRSRLEPRGEDDIVDGPPQLDRFDPDVVYAEVSASPIPMLNLYLDRPAEELIDISLNSSDSDIVFVEDEVSFQPGQESISVEIQALQAQQTPVIIEAFDGEVTVSATVYTYDDEMERYLESFGAQKSGFLSDETLIFTAELNVPAPSGGDTLDLEFFPSFDAGLPGEITFAPGDKVAEVSVELSDDLVGRHVAAATHENNAEFFGFEIFLASEIFLETFSNFSTSGTAYHDGSFTGDLGFDWHYTNARQATGTSSPTPIDDNSMTFQTDEGSVRAENIPGDISTFAVDMKKAFTGAGDRQLALLINDEEVATSIVFDEDDVVHEFRVDDIGVTGGFDLEVSSIGGRQITIDNLRWSDGPTLEAAPEEVDFAPILLDSFAPDFAFLEVSDSPEDVLTLHSLKPALEETTVSLSYGDSAIVGPDEVTFQPGEFFVTIALQADEGRPEPVEIEASFDGQTVTAEVHPFDETTPRTITALEACPSALVDHPVEFLVEIDIPAGEDGFAIDVEVDPDSAVTSSPSEVILDEGQFFTTFSLTFVEEHSSVDVTLTTNDDEETLNVATFDATPPLVEDFSQLQPDPDFGDGNFTGNYGLLWSYFGARGTESQAIDGISLLFDADGTRSLEVTNPPGGLSSFEVEARLTDDADEDGQLELFIDSQSLATSEVLEVPSNGDPQTLTFVVDDIDGQCVQALELRSIGDGEVVIDNLTLSPYTL